MDERVRILILISGLAIGESLGGAERFGVELACHLDQRKFQPILCALWRHNTAAEQHWADHLRRANVELLFGERSLGRNSLAQFVRGVNHIAVQLSNVNVNIIHSHFQLGSIAALLLKQRLNACALIRTAHAGKEWGETLSGHLCRQIFTKWIFPLFFDAEVGVSQSVVESLDCRPAARLLGKKALLIHNAIPLDRFTRPVPPSRIAAARQEFGISKNDLVVGSIGRLRKEKGYSILIDAARLVRNQFQNVKFVIVGSGEQWDFLHRKVNQIGLASTVIFTGARQDVEVMYNLMDLFVLPSLWEGLPTVILESMACGVPVVATDIPGTRELIQHGYTGWLAQPGDPRSLAMAIISALSSPSQRAQVARAARQKVVPRFSIQGSTEKYENLYLQLIAETRYVQSQ